MGGGPCISILADSGELGVMDASYDVILAAEKEKVFFLLTRYPRPSSSRYPADSDSHRRTYVLLDSILGLKTDRITNTVRIDRSGELQ